MTKSTDPMRSQAAAIEVIQRAGREGRPIVPFLGAGVSIPTGFPSMASITSYLAKTYFYLDNLYDPPYKPRDVRKETIVEYLRAYGWPNYNRLNADLWRKLSKGSESELSTIRNKIIDIYKNKILDGRSNRIATRAIKALDRIWNQQNARPQLVVDTQHLLMLARQDRGLAHEVVNQILRPNRMGFFLRGNWYDLMMEMTEGSFDLIDALFASLGRGRRFGAVHTFLAQLVNVFGTRLFLTLNFDPFLEDALRAEGQNPMVIDTFRDAELPPALVVRQNLAVLKLHGGAYGVRIGERIQESLDTGTRDRALEIIPEDALVLLMGFSGYERRMVQMLESIAMQQKRYKPSLLWMHWNPEPDQPIQDLKSRLDRSNMLHSIQTARLASPETFLLELLCVEGRDFPAPRRSYSALPTRGPSQDGRQTELLEEDQASAQNTPQIAPSLRPQEDLLPRKGRRNGVHKLPEAQIHVFCDKAAIFSTEPRSDTSCHGLEMSRWCSAREKDMFHSIWIDCEGHHTAEGVITDIIDRVRARDPLFPPLLLRSGHLSARTTDPAVDRQLLRGVERIREALQRGRYILCLDSIEAFGRPQTVHHGIPTFKNLVKSSKDVPDQDDRDALVGFKKQVEAFYQFLGLLLADEGSNDKDSDWPNVQDIGESYIAVAIHPPTSRHSPSTREADDRDSALSKIRSRLVNLLNVLVSKEQCHRIPSQNPWEIHDISSSDLTSQIDLLPDEGPRKEEIQDLLCSLIGKLGIFHTNPTVLRMILSFMRRPRSYLAFKSLMVQSGVSHVCCNNGGPVELTPVENLSCSFFIEFLGIRDRDGEYTSNYGERIIEGGTIWLERNNRNKSHNMLSDYPRIVTDALKEHGANASSFAETPAALDGKASLNVETCTLYLLVLTVAHRKVARYYFSELYASSGDLAAFREYIYHRTSFLRHMARLCYLLEHPALAVREDSTIEEKREFWSRVLGGSASDSIALRNSILEHLGLPESERRFVADFIEGLIEARLRELQAFRATLSREATHIRSSSYASSWPNWLLRLIKVDCDLFQFDHLRMAAEQRSPSKRLEPSYKRFLDEVTRLKEDLNDQMIQFLTEKGDLAGARAALVDAFFARAQGIGPPDPALGHRGRCWVLLLPIRLVVNGGKAGKKVNPKKDYLTKFSKLLFGQEEQDLDKKFADVICLFEEVLIKQNKVTKYNVADVNYHKDLLAPVNPATVIECAIRFVEMAEDLIRIAAINHQLRCSNPPLPIGTTPSSSGLTIMNLARRFLDPVRLWSQSILPILEAPPIDEHGAMVSREMRYSRPSQGFLRRELDRVELEWIHQDAIEATKGTNAWEFTRTGPEPLDPEVPVRRGLVPAPTEMGKVATQKARNLHEFARQTVFEDRNQYNLFRARSLTLEVRGDYLYGNRFAESQSQLSRASRLISSGGPSQASDRVAIHRAAAQCFMIQANQLLDRGGKTGLDSTLTIKEIAPEEGWNAWRHDWLQAEDLLIQAGANFRTAQQHFNDCQSNVVWWLRLTRDLAQWSIEAALANVCGFPIWLGQRQSDRSAVARFDNVMEFGVSCIRASLDATPRNPPDELENKASKRAITWCLKQWLWLLAITFWHDYLHYIRLEVVSESDLPVAILVHSEFYPEGEFDKKFRDRWELLNKVYRMPSLVNGKAWLAIRQTLPRFRMSPTVSIFPFKSEVHGDGGRPATMQGSSRDLERWRSIRQDVLRLMCKLTQESPIEVDGERNSILGFLRKDLEIRP